MKVSVCLASYNGEKFILQQIESILSQLDASDEVIIVDDCSKDRTVSILRELNDSRIKIHVNTENKGHIYSFSKAINLAVNDIIFLSDQDDVWKSGRVNVMKMSLMNSSCLLVTSNADFINGNGELIDFNITGVRSEDSNKSLKNILSIFAGKKNYYGCAMAFHKDLKKMILPFPAYIESHDLFSAMAANILGKNLHIDDQTFSRRIHGNNLSVVSRSLYLKLRTRWYFAKGFWELCKRKFQKKI